jgi:1-acyl-sn-glycerol-3-phosphate acyltransferase
MAAHVGAPVLPVGLVGTDDIMPKSAKFPRLRGSVSVCFGEPMRITQQQADDDPLALRSFVDGLMYQIRELSGQEYRDEYAGKKPKAAEPVGAAA